MEQIAETMKSLSETLGDTSSEKVRTAAKKIADVSLDNFNGQLLHKGLAVSEALAALAEAFDNPDSC